MRSRFPDGNEQLELGKVAFATILAAWLLRHPAAWGRTVLTIVQFGGIALLLLLAAAQIARTASSRIILGNERPGDVEGSVRRLKLSGGGPRPGAGRVWVTFLRVAAAALILGAIAVAGPQTTGGSALAVVAAAAAAVVLPGVAVGVGLGFAYSARRRTC